MNETRTKRMPNQATMRVAAFAISMLGVVAASAGETMRGIACPTCETTWGKARRLTNPTTVYVSVQTFQCDMCRAAAAQGRAGQKSKHVCTHCGGLLQTCSM